MFSRRKFLSKLGLTTFGIGLSGVYSSCNANDKAGPTATIDQLAKNERKAKPTIISTWYHGLPANEAGWKIIEKGGRAVDAVEQGVRVPEADPKSTSVGYGGKPDREGNVTLDACIMDEKGNCGSVCFLKNFMHPISVARKVMDESPHVMMAGIGAQEFALSKGFKKMNLLTPESKIAWEEWTTENNYKPMINVENHDTIGMLALDQSGHMAGACTTSGLAYKMHGRVGDSPIIGAGLFVDNEVGGAVATGHGEKVIETVGSFLVVELMRQGASPQEACEEAVHRIIKRNKDYQDIQIGYLAMNMKGDIGSFCIHKGFNYALYQDEKNQMVESKFYHKN